MTVAHYENFPVASWLCPAKLRPAVQAIYWFARTADDIADEGHATAADRRAALARYHACLHLAAAGCDTTEWPQVFKPLAHAIERHRLPIPLLAALLDAFEQDTHNPIHADRTALLDYCSRSANPIGRLLLHLVGVVDAPALAQSDAVCTALQLINFWQDLSIDLARGRHYIPEADLVRAGLARAQLAPGADTDATRALVRLLVAWTRETMHRGAPLVHRLEGRFGWELRLVVQGGLRVLDRIEAAGCNALGHRPKLGAADALPIAWRALRMREAAHRAAPLAQGPGAQ